MASGERSFSNYGASGEDTGTGADLFIRLGFYPQWVEVLNTSNNAYIKWNKEMPAGSGYLFGSGGATFNGTPMVGHTHSPQVINLTTSTNTIRIYFTAAVGTFSVGETITGGTSGHTATVGAVSMANQFLVVTGPTGNFVDAEVITGGTSGATATTVGALYNNWDVSATYNQNSLITAVGTNTNVALIQGPPTMLLGAGLNYYRYRRSDTVPGIETPRADGWTELRLIGLDPSTSSNSAGAPAGVITSSNAGIYILTGGITGGADGFTIGDEELINSLGENLVWNVGR